MSSVFTVKYILLHEWSTLRGYDAANQPLLDTGHRALDSGVLGCQDRCILGSEAQMQGHDETEPPALVADTRTTACTY